jgi:hypothetical protein
MHGTIVAGEIADETLDDLGGQSTALEKTAHIKQVARMLSSTKRLMAVPPFIAMPGVANTAGAHSRRRRTVSM